MYIIGIDVGTTGTKALVVDEKGKIYGKGYMEYSLLTGENGIVEQNAEDWWAAVVCSVNQSIAQIEDKEQIKAISLSSQGGTTLAVDKNFAALNLAYTWMDRRAAKENEEIISELGKDYIYKKSGWQPDACFDPAKLRWMSKNQKDIFDSAAYFVSTCEFINYRLTGSNVTDPENAAMRQLIDIQTGDWDEKLVQAAKLSIDRLPKCIPTGEYIGNLTKMAAESLGLSTDVKVFNGAHDQYCASIGSCAVNVGDMLISTGTTWVVLGVTDKPLYTDNYIAPGIHPCNERYGNIASLRSAGSALKWLCQTIGENDFRRIDEEASYRRQSAKNIYFYPYYAGAGFPHNLDNLKANIIGMELMNDKYDLAYSLMEGVAFETRSVLDEFAKNGCDISNLKMVGGAAKSEFWSKLTCDITGCEIALPEEADTCCIGAAIIGAVGLEIYPDYETAGKNMIQIKKKYSPNNENKEFYNEKYKKYSDILNSLKSFYSNL